MSRNLYCQSFVRSLVCLFVSFCIAIYFVSCSCNVMITVFCSCNGKTAMVKIKLLSRVLLFHHWNCLCHVDAAIRSFSPILRTLPLDSNKHLHESARLNLMIVFHSTVAQRRLNNSTVSFFHFSLFLCVKYFA